MPRLPPLVRVTAPSVSSAVRASRAAGRPIPAALAMMAVVAPPGRASSAARTAAAGLPGPWPVSGAGAGAGALCAALGAACGRAAGFFGCAMSWLHSVSGGILF
jgi:hypothetical protein